MLKDMTRVINALASPMVRVYQNFVIKRSHPSAWSTYPDKYKFIGLQINVSDVRLETHRKTTDLLRLVAYIGGATRFSVLIGSLLVARFGKMRLSALLANRFYTWDTPDSFRKMAAEDTRKWRWYKCWWGHNQLKTSILSGTRNNVSIPIPFGLNIVQLMYTFCFCFCRRDWYREYLKTLVIVNKDIDKGLDILNLLRRLRMHGFGVATMFKEDERKFIAGRAENKPLKEVIDC